MRAAVVLLALAGASSSCAAPVCEQAVDAHPEQRKCSDGAIERVETATCAATPCSFAPNPAGGGACEADFNCVANDGAGDGSCIDGSCVCDACRVDDDCAARTLCACFSRGRVGAGCVFGCRTSADCRGGERCIQVLDGPEFACQALDSACRSTRDCWWPADRCIPAGTNSSSWTCTSKIAPTSIAAE